MKAIVLREFGGPEVLRCEEVPTPEPGPGEAVLRVHAVSVNRTFDLVVRAGDYPRVKAENLPLVLGVDAAGIVEAVGADVTNLQPGDRVALNNSIRCGECETCLAGQDEDCTHTKQIGVDMWGGYAEYVLAPARALVPVPESLSFPEAAVIVRHFPTAFNQVETRAKVQPGEWVLVMGAAGALGSCCVQVAKIFGATVIAAAGADERVEAARSYGADYGINYRTQDLAEEVLRLTDGQGVQVVFENIADPTLWPGAFKSLGWRGRLVTSGAHGGGQVTLDVRQLYLRRQHIIGTAGSGGRHVARTLEMAGQGKLHATVGKVMSLWDAPEAHRLVQSNTVLGKVVLDPTI